MFGRQGHIIAPHEGCRRFRTRYRCCGYFPGVHDRHHDCSREARRWSPLVQCSDDLSPRLLQDSLAKKSRQHVLLQFASSTRAGVDCVGHVVRAMTDADPHATVLSVDGIGAFDHVHHASMMSKLLEVPGFCALLPFVRVSYRSPFALHLGGRSRTEPRDSATRRRRTRLQVSLAIHNRR